MLDVRLDRRPLDVTRPQPDGDERADHGLRLDPAEPIDHHLAVQQVQPGRDPPVLSPIGNLRDHHRQADARAAAGSAPREPAVGPAAGRAPAPRRRQLLQASLRTLIAASAREVNSKRSPRLARVTRASSTIDSNNGGCWDEISLRRLNRASLSIRSVHSQRTVSRLGAPRYRGDSLIEGSDADSFAYSLSNFAEIIFPCLEAVKAAQDGRGRRVQGDDTRDLLAWGEQAGCKVTAVEPVPRRSCSSCSVSDRSLSWSRRRASTRFADIELGDAIILDGDHNYYTPTNELRLIDDRAPRGLPLVLPPRRRLAPRAAATPTRHPSRSRRSIASRWRTQWGSLRGAGVVDRRASSTRTSPRARVAPETA